MFAAAGLTYHPEAMQIRKLETYTKNEQGDFIPLDALGENIVWADHHYKSTFKRRMGAGIFPCGSL